MSKETKNKSVNNKTAIKKTIEKKKKKDPNAPKKALSAYFLWLNDNRNTIKKPGMGVADVAKAAGLIWRGMEAEDKAKWEKKAEDDKRRYASELEIYKRKKEDN
ncbi:FACT complex subunit SSRP1 [Strongyloides ratti]|uniref:FACT complex subunit SSRP1 n=1 Tax=Strongyloides ratti TaxID=34506 RepID=A0A090LDT9_STRRB|nr:FACT complex subunit SSRP1 [Strongyloides ratti]CEF65660.1 FACT complex subunit SSRP1 [Strongyloides ratti]